MFRDVPECSGMFHVPGFIDAHADHLIFAYVSLRLQFTIFHSFKVAMCFQALNLYSLITFVSTF